MPEKSENDGMPNSVIALDAGKAADNWALKTQSNRIEAMGFALVHGAGHNAGLSHDDGGIMTNGNVISDRIVINTLRYEDLIKHYTEEYVNSIRTNYGQYKSIKDFICPLMMKII